MLLEVHAGIKPGRPVLLLVLSALLLVAALALAWFQVQAARALGPERRVGNTPLWVRLPRGWRADPRDPRRFVVPVAEQGRRAAFEFERRIQFDFVRRPMFQPLDELMRVPEFGGAGKVVYVVPAKIGRCDAVEVHRIEPLRIRGERGGRRTVERLTCLPRGHVIRVLYEPLSDFRPADREILDEICQTLRIDDPTVAETADEYLRHAGLKVSLEADWQVVGTDFADAPGVYIGGSSDGLPAWSIAIIRTWLATGREPRDLLTDFAGEHWLLWDLARQFRENRRADGAAVLSVRHPEFGQVRGLIPSAWVVAQAPAQAVILYVWAGPQEAAMADEVAARLAAAVQIEPLGSIPRVADAEQAGLRLVQDLQKNGPAPRWGRQPVDTKYVRTNRDEFVFLHRAAVDSDPARGYEGSQRRRVNQVREERVKWQLDGHAGQYTWQLDSFHGPTQVRVSEQRPQPDGPITRQVYVDERLAQRFSFTPGPGFVAPPADSILKGWAARREAPAALVEVSSPLGPGTHTLLLRHLPPDGSWPRVFVQQDYWPLGSIEAYDDSRAETEYEQYPAAEYRRVK